MSKKKTLNQLKKELEEYRVDVEVSKSTVFQMLKDKKAKVIAEKKKYSKKDRRQNKIKYYEDID